MTTYTVTSPVTGATYTSGGAYTITHAGAMVAGMQRSGLVPDDVLVTFEGTTFKVVRGMVRGAL